MGILYESISPKIEKIVRRYFEGEDLKAIIEDEKAEIEAETLLKILKHED
ncbi:hypothetical protein SAMN02745945_01805 [Peptoclostridium litorale DSM 5388]|uniref:Uncharacterized protein n=1 Tax=Peptoclostridium litorale DSM 5388 TaxID=1121324 RepID=A0A069RFX5_PEPLI|nr:hypothetical protein [Peptoclostridium litorale]KDR95921.1 hypothetical protein CLIT_8c00900 [Peptoclostridium litorale DSM 5388]SIO09935.1 hypothetical protein SAMN02745945_01805 [Peptoclostridium litorale DSM 5388]